MKKFLLMGLTAMMTCFLVLTTFSSCGSNDDDDEIPENYFIKASVCDKGTLPDAIYKELQNALSKRISSFSDLKMATSQLDMSSGYTESQGAVYLGGGDDYQLPREYAYKLEFQLYDKSGKTLDSRKIEMKPVTPEEPDLHLHKHVRIYDKGTLSDLQVEMLNLTFDGIEELNKISYMAVKTTDEAKQQLRDSLDTLKQTLPKDSDYTLKFYITDENEEVIYRLYFILKNGEASVSETI